MYGSVVFDLPKKPFEEHARGAPAALRRSARHRPPGARRCRRSCGRFKEHDPERDRSRVPRRSRCEQLWGAIAAVFESWNTRRADRLPETARHPRHAWAPRSTWWRWCSATSARTPAPASRSAAIPPPASAALYGEYLLNAQGEDVVSGSADAGSRSRRWSSACPHSYQELERVARTLERHFRDVQDMEFTIERGALYMLQTRRGPALGSRRGAHRLRDGGRGAHLRGGGGRAGSRPTISTSCSTPRSTRRAQLDLLTTGLPASPGAACGTVVFDADRAEKLGRAGQSVDPGAAGDLARGLPRHGAGQGDPHRARRHDVARRRRGARHGQAVCGGRAGRSRWTRRPKSLLGQRSQHRRRRLDHRGRQHAARSTPARPRSSRRS